nr:hypothetical protein GCM10017745_34500 [Saccharothrix mutabilis subsp. capreolus]
MSVWFSPVTRVIAGLIAVLVGLAAFPLSNLGGFFVGTLCAVVGGAMAASWGEPRPKSPGGTDTTEPDEAAEPKDAAEPDEAAEPARGTSRGPVALVALGLSVALPLTMLATPRAEAAPALVPATDITVTAGAGWVGGLHYRGNETLTVADGAGRTRQVEVMHWVLDEFTVHSDLDLKATASNGVTLTLRQEAAPFTDNASFRAVGEDKVDLYLTPSRRT